MKRSFFQAAVASILLYGCTIWTLTKRLEKKLDGNYTRMLRAILNKSWRQHPTRHQLYGHLPPITKTIQVRRTCRTLLEKQGRTHKWCTLMDPHTWPCKSRTTSTNIHSATIWGYGMLSRRPAWGDEPWWYIYSHPQTDCFVLSELFSVARHAGRSEPGSKPVQLYARLWFRPLVHQADHVGLGNFKGFLFLATAAAAFVYIFLYPIGYQSAQFFRRASHYASGGRQFLIQDMIKIIEIEFSIFLI